MQFKHPEILFALFLLIIPIIVHLFQLQRFVKVPFTNVQFLKQVISQTRKSSQLKKWLILITRLLAFASIIFAFSQPFFSAIEKDVKTENIIYLDNSLSMQSKIEGIEILKKVSNEIIENTSKFSDITFLTNDKILKNLNGETLKNELLNVEFSTNSLDLNTVLLRINQLNNNKTKTSYNTILISDFQFISKKINPNVTNVNSSLKLLNVKNYESKNIGIDSVYISQKTATEITLKVVVTIYNSSKKSSSISLFNNDSLIGKSSINKIEHGIKEVEFKIPNREFTQGKISVDDEFLEFDNTLFFTLTKPEKIKILSIGNSQNYLSKILTEDNFDLTQQNENDVNYNNLRNQHLIILNELETISPTLNSNIIEFINNGGSVFIIPSNNIKTESYNTLFSNLDLGNVSEIKQDSLKITNINYNHPILNGVFEKTVQNFNYPSVYSYYQTNFKNNSTIFSLENNSIFISESKRKKGRIYWSAAPLSEDATNFSKSPLIVPTIYNIAKNSYKTTELYYTIGRENIVTVNISLGKDEVLTLKSDDSEIIPLQQLHHNKVDITTKDQPNKSGFYSINHGDTPLKTIAFNYDRTENKFDDINLNELFKDYPNISISNSINDTFLQLADQQKIKPLFKWFLLLAVVFLLMEMCILKYFKV